MCRRMCYTVKLCAGSSLSHALGVSDEECRAMNHRASLIGSAEVQVT